jgi:hypothetical protein
MCAPIPTARCQKSARPRGGLVNRAGDNALMWCAVLVSVASFAATTVPPGRETCTFAGIRSSVQLATLRAMLCSLPRK